VLFLHIQCSFNSAVLLKKEVSVFYEAYCQWFWIEQSVK